jgi:hypothetical protein
VCALSSPLDRADADEIAWMTLSSPALFERLSVEARLRSEREQPFGLVLDIDGIELDRYRTHFPRMCHLPGGRARFGSWCRGVVYVFESSLAEAGARVHLEHADRIWGARVHTARSDERAAAWLRTQFVRYGNARR